MSHSWTTAAIVFSRCTDQALKYGLWAYIGPSLSSFWNNPSAPRSCEGILFHFVHLIHKEQGSCPRCDVMCAIQSHVYLYHSYSNWGCPYHFLWTLFNTFQTQSHLTPEELNLSSYEQFLNIAVMWLYSLGPLMETVCVPFSDLLPAELSALFILGLQITLENVKCHVVSVYYSFIH